MTLLIVIILVAILIVAGIYLIKNTAKRAIAPKVPAQTTQTQVNDGSPTPPSVNPGSIPDRSGTRGDGGSALSSGKQG